MINTLLKAQIVRRFIQLGIKPIRAMNMAARMEEGDAIFIVRNHINLKPQIILTLIKNNIKKDET
ncbi:MAG: hypothetical protein CMQ38_09930 [Gammaproteobacteria bacterium]|nr:hypothetical protein [Gammaproteobacteria bacterium]